MSALMHKTIKREQLVDVVEVAIRLVDREVVVPTFGRRGLRAAAEEMPHVLTSDYVDGDYQCPVAYAWSDWQDLPSWGELFAREFDEVMRDRFGIVSNTVWTVIE
jgi:hypothetical protein